jgi:uncharacterized membrane protein (TIGR01666 family)
MINIPQTVKTKNWYIHLTQSFWSKPDRLTAAKVVIAMLVQAVPFVIWGNLFMGITLSLGSVAAALAETDDHPNGRLKALIITIIGFAITTFSVSLLKPYPIIFGIGFIASTILFVLIGGISERYRGISYGAILIGIYAMIVYQKDMEWYLQPLLLCCGALFYGIISLILLYQKPWRLLEEQLSRGFITLSDYLEEKAKIFPNYENNDDNSDNRLAILNIQVVSALEKCKEVINIYNQEVESKDLLPYLQRFMLLQSLHERAASSHERYEVLQKKLEYKELLEGFSELLYQLSHATRLVAENMLTGVVYRHPVGIGWIVSALDFEIEKLPKYDRQILELLLHNLSRSHQSLKKLDTPEESTSIPRLGQDNRSIYMKIKDQLNWKHPRLRYAIRLSTCFLIGYLLVYFFKPENGEWIMLTSLFVSQPTYSETRRRLFQRILGTLTGVIVGVSLLHFLPTNEGQLLLVLVSTYFFFYFLRKKYSYAVIFITIYVLASNSISASADTEILLPRIIDTFAGAFIAFLAIRLLWPNWQHKQLPLLLSSALANNASYLNHIWIEYQKPQDDDYNYRLARRLAHKSDNALTLAWQSMQVEPKKRKKMMKQVFTLTYLNHALLSHLSAFGAQREELSADLRDIHDIINNIEKALKLASEKLKQQVSDDSHIHLTPVLMQLKEKISNETVKERQQQLRLLYNITAVSQKLLRESEEMPSSR